jgi:hypothetical protein
MAELSLVTLLRGTYAWNLKLTEWQDFKGRVEAELRNRDAPVSQILMGI